jgi:hypothetical protein
MTVNEKVKRPSFVFVNNFCHRTFVIFNSHRQTHNPKIARELSFANQQISTFTSILNSQGSSLILLFSKEIRIT